jgi:kinesin family protein 18/19
MSENEDENNVSNIHVCVRIRPIEKCGNKSIVRVINPNIIILNPYEGIISSRASYPAVIKNEYKFAFDNVFDDTASQQKVYEKTCKHLIKILLDGFNASVFAYGATGSGKTHTMIGNKQGGRGIMYLMLNDIFEAFEKESERGRKIKMDVSYVEVYNENIKDLLCLKTKCKQKYLELWEDPKLGVTIQNVSVHHPKNAEDVFNLLGVINILLFVILI